MCRANDRKVLALTNETFRKALLRTGRMSGLAAKPLYYPELLTTHLPLELVEVQAEHHMGDGGAETLDRDYLALWRMLVNRYDPVLGGSSFKAARTVRIPGRAQWMPL